MRKLEYKNVAIIIHPLHTWGGAEYNLDVMARLFNNPTVYTAWYNDTFVQEHLNRYKIRSSFLQRLPFKKKLYKYLIPFLPSAYRSLDLNGHDLVIVVSDGFEKFIKKPVNVDLIHYILTPARFLWMNNGSYSSNNALYLFYKRFLSKFMTNSWQRQDKQYAKQADRTLAISKAVQKRVAKYYGLDSVVVYPPVESYKMKYNRSVENREDWFLYLGRVESYKGVDIAIQACVETGSKLKVAGTGSELDQMKELVKDLHAKHLIGFLGFVSEKMKRELLYKCRALIYPVMDEDFGIVPVEANASGCPVIAYKSGGVEETVVDGRTGIFFDRRNVEDLAKALSKYDAKAFSAEECRKRSLEFSREAFENKIRNEINGLIKR